MKQILVVMTFLLLFPFIGESAENKDADIKINSKRLPLIATTFEACYVTEEDNLAIVLSDGSQWIIKDVILEDAYNSIYKKWKVGDDIRVKKVDNEEDNSVQFLVKNVRSSDVYLAYLDKHCQDTSRALSIKKVDQNGYLIVTNNGIEWCIGWLGSFTSEKWRPGDRVTINKSDYYSKEDYLLINASDSSSCWGNVVYWRE